MGGPYKPGKHFVSTRKDNAVYLHFLGWTGESEFEILPPLPAKIAAAMLMDGSALAFEQTPGAVRLHVPEKSRQPGITVVNLQLDRSAIDIVPIETL